MPTNGAQKKMVTNRAQKTGHQASKAQVAQQKLAVQYFFAAKQSLRLNPDFSGAKASFMALRCTSVLPAKSGSRLIV